MKPMSQYLPQYLSPDLLRDDELPPPSATADCLPTSALSAAAAGLHHRNRLTSPWLVCAAMLTLCVVFLQGSLAWAHSTPPVITAVTPSPLTVGTVTVTIQGTGFVATSLVYNSYGSNSMIQYAPSSVTSTSISVTIYQGTASTSTFCVGSSSGNCSNSITVPVTTASSGGGGGNSSGSGSGGSSNSAAAPVVSSVSPNPLSVGTINIVITGSGFLQGAMAYQSYGSNSMIQYSPSSMTSNSLTVTGIYQGAATTASFEVCNPGRVCSNALAVPVNSPAPPSNPTYTLTVNNGTISTGGTSGTFASGASVTIVADAPPSGQAFQSWTGASVTNPIAASTTLTMPAESVAVTANYYTPAPVPTPVTSHPRLWITQQDLPRLQSWATSGNIAYQGLGGALGAALGNYALAFPPGPNQSLTNPVPASPYPDFGDDQGYTGMLSEENAVILAFNSLINPNSANRILYAQEAHNLLMYAMNQAVQGHAVNQPFRDPSFAIYNRGSFTGHEWPLIVDWIYNATDASGNPILTAADKQTIRSVFMLWASDCITAETTGGDNPGTPGLVNSLALLPGNLPYRMASNNYFLAHARLLTMMSLVLDPADDPPANPGVPAAEIGNTLRSYINDATGAWLYEEFAMMGDPATVAAAYNVPANPTGAGFGLASGGLPPEGSLYGESFAYILGQLLALETSGFNNPEYSGPQIGLIGAPVWDRYTQGYLSSLTPTSAIPANESYLGNVYRVASYGDVLRKWVTPDQMAPFALLGLLDQEQGISTHVDAARWYAMNAMPNGASGLLARMENPWTWGVTQDLLYFLLLDPNAPPATDPRPAFPTVFYDPPAGRIVAHSDWTPNGTMFDYRASWISINHQVGGGGEFGLFRKGEWLTSEMSNYDGTNGLTTEFHNTLALENYCAVCATITWQGPDAPIWANGSQWMLGENAGDPTTAMSTGAGYVYANSNLTNLFNRPDRWSAPDVIDNITQATRSIVWLNNDYIVVYDRATSVNGGLFKRFNLSLAANPAIEGKTTTETMPDGQQLFVQTLLPLSPSITSINGAALLNPVADLETMQYILQVQDNSNPSDTRFLHVLQGADSGATMAPAAYVQSTGGAQFDGAAFGSSAVYFPVSTAGSFGGTTLSLPAGIHTVLVTGLSPDTGYGVQASNGSVNVVPSGNTMTDSAGVLAVNF